MSSINRVKCLKMADVSAGLLIWHMLASFTGKRSARETEEGAPLAVMG